MIAWEGMEVMGNGVVYGGDELGPGGASPGAPGGSVYKFIPSTLYVAKTAVSTLAESPLAAGKAYAMRISCQPTTVVYGQGCQVGTGDWVQIDPATARADAEANGATGYYRPEDMTRDKTVKLPATKLCFTATGNPESKQFAEVICLTDSSVATAPERNGGGTSSTPSSRNSSCWAVRPSIPSTTWISSPAGTTCTSSRTPRTATPMPASPTVPMRI